jgi:hypothetical protein
MTDLNNEQQYDDTQLTLFQQHRKRYWKRYHHRGKVAVVCTVSE